RRATDGMSSVSGACDDPNLCCMSAARNDPSASAASSGTVIMIAPSQPCGRIVNGCEANGNTVRVRGCSWNPGSSSRKSTMEPTWNNARNCEELQLAAAVHTPRGGKVVRCKGFLASSDRLDRWPCATRLLM